MNSFVNFLEGSFVEALGWTLVHSLWQGALVMIILMVIFGLTQGKNAHVRYGFATAALMLMLLWSGVTFMSYYSNPSSTLEMNMAIEAPLVANDVVIGPIFTLENSVEPVESSIWSLPYWTDKLEGFMHTNSPFIAAFWLFGSMLFFLKWLGSLLYIHRIRRTAILQVPTDWQKRLDNIAKRMGILKTVQLVESIRVNTPMVVGHFKPLILVPAGLLTGMSPEQIETILIHELAHIRRNDYVINLIQSVLEIIYFYHPAYWWIADKIKQEREHCCDDIAVAVCGDAMLYARALTEVQARKHEAVPALAMAATGRKNHLMNRVKRILLPTQERGNMTGKVILSFILLLSVWSFAWVEEVPKVHATDILNTPIDITEIKVPSDVVVPFIIPPVTAPGFEAPDEVPFPDFVPEPIEIPVWDGLEAFIDPVEIPEEFAFSAASVNPELDVVIPENFDFRFNFQFPDAVTSFQQYFEFSFAFVDSPKPYLYRFQPRPDMPAMPALPDVSWENEDARKMYEEALKLYELERMRYMEEEAKLYEEVQRIQEEYAKVYEERALENNQSSAKKLKRELNGQVSRAQDVDRKMRELHDLLGRSKQLYDEGKMSKNEFRQLQDRLDEVYHDSQEKQRSAEQLIMNLQQELEGLAKIKDDTDLRALEKELMYQHNLAQIAERQAEQAKIQAMMAKTDFSEGRIDHRDLAKLEEKSLAMQRKAVLDKRKSERMMLELQHKAERLADTENQRERLALERELNKLRELEKLKLYESELAQQQAIQRQHEQLSRLEVERQKLQAEKQRRQSMQDQQKLLLEKEIIRQHLQAEEQRRMAERQMRLMEEKMRIQEEYLRKQEKEVNQRVEKMGKALKSELIKDGYIDTYDDNLYINIKDDYMKVNGERIKSQHYKKYLRIINDHDLHFGEGSNFTIQF